MRSWQCIFALLASAVALGQVPQTSFRGCINRRPDGVLQLGVRPSGDLFLLQGDPNLLQEHVNHLVQITGHSQPGQNSGLPRLTVDTIQSIAGSCTKALPAKKPVPGKVGEDAVAVPVTTAKTADQTTPGVQTETGMAQSPGAKSPSQYESRPPSPSPYTPAEPEQVAQSEAAANLNAEAANRAEILPGNILGVNRSAATPGTQSSGTPSVVSRSETTQQPAVVHITADPTAELLPLRLTIAVGQTVEWRNSSAAIREIIANPAKAQPSGSAQLPVAAKPFDSGFLRPNGTFSHRFTIPGVYRYVCGGTDSQRVIGEIVVKP